MAVFAGAIVHEKNGGMQLKFADYAVIINVIAVS
jgi:hypothetical protein